MPVTSEDFRQQAQWLRVHEFRNSVSADWMDAAAERVDELTAALQTVMSTLSWAAGRFEISDGQIPRHVVETLAVARRVLYPDLSTEDWERMGAT